MTTDELRRAEATYKVAFGLSETERQKRNQAVREAIAQGMTHAQISEATGGSALRACRSLS